MRVRSILAVSAMCALVASNPAWPLPTGFTDSPVVSGLQYPTTILFVPDGRVLIGQITGEVRVYQNGALLASPLITLPVENFEEQGLLGMALHPNFPDSAYLYILYTPPTGHQTNNHHYISRFTVTGNTANLASEAILFTGFPTGPGYHVAGCIRTTAGGYLYATDGDNGSGQAGYQYAQDRSRLEGKMIRLKLDGSIPSGNPFVGVAGARPEIYHYGLRNPFRFAIQPGTGTPFINDVGWNGYDEIDTGAAGRNFGWPLYEGDAGPAGFTHPLFNESINGNSCYTGGAFYTGTQFPAEYRGNYFFMNHSRGLLGRIVLGANNSVVSADPEWGQTPVAGWGYGPVDLAQGVDGALWYLTFNPGTLRRVSYASLTGVGDGPAARLELNQNWPNPMNKVTRFRFALPSVAPISLAIYDLRGSRVRMLASGMTATGPHYVQWDGLDDEGRPAAPGIYLYRLESGRTVLSKRLALIQ